MLWRADRPQSRHVDVVKEGVLHLQRDSGAEKCRVRVVDSPDGAVLELTCPPKVRPACRSAADAANAHLGRRSSPSAGLPSLRSTMCS